MATQEQGSVKALSLAEQAAALLEDDGDAAGSLRLKHAIAIIRNDGRYSSPPDLEEPLSLMCTALALLDRDGNGSSITACHLQHAVDCARGAKPLAEGEEIDPDLLNPFTFGPVPTILN